MFLGVDLLNRRILVQRQRDNIERGGIRKCASAKSHSRESRGAWHELHYTSLLCGWCAAGPFFI
jgi:hypothetical protein